MKNILITGNMNSGKTEKIKEEVKRLIKNNESMIILDSKEEYSELFEDTDYEVKVISFRDLKNSLKYNLFNYAKTEYKNGNIDKSINIIKDIFDNLFVIPEDRDPFWDKTASEYVTSIALYLLKTNQELNFKEIIRVLNKDSEDFKKYISSIDILDTCSLLASPTVYAPQETKGGIISVAKQVMNLLAYQPTLLENLCGYDEIEIKNKNQAIILVNFDEQFGINRVMTAILSQLISRLYDLKNNYNLILDNYESLTNNEYFERIFETCNARNISSLVAVRNIAVISKKDAFEK